MSALGANRHADCRRSLVAGPEPALCSGLGRHLPHNAKKNPRPLQAVTLGDLYAMLDDPQQVPKDRAPWFIPSTLVSRTHAEQRERGRFLCLWAETDKPSGSLRDMAARVAGVVGPEVLADTKDSATGDRQTARFLVPLSMSVSGQVFVFMQEVLNERSHACGIPPERSNERAGQLCYLPNRGAYYDAIHPVLRGGVFRSLRSGSESTSRRGERPRWRLPAPGNASWLQCWRQRSRNSRPHRWERRQVLSSCQPVTASRSAIKAMKTGAYGRTPRCTPHKKSA